ncbi:MAG: MCE family protein [Chitinivibrionales bacterium]|nr:MCE family protein [Chitinivibrionales bacterium]MBD3394745.1 MCE family protein [Chitinivibrionales bacterium]
MSTKSPVRELRREPFHYRHRNLFVGLFILVPVVLIPDLVVYALVRSDFLENWHHLYVQYENAEGLEKGSTVNIRGINVGHVESLSLNKRGHVDVRFRVKSRVAPLVKKNSVVRLKQKNFVVGDWELHIGGGGEFAPAAEEGDTLKGELPLQLDQTVQQVTHMVASLESILQKIMAGEGALGYLMGKDTLDDAAAGFAARIDKLFDRVDALLADADAMLASLTSFGSHGTATVDTLMTFSHHADSLVASLHETARHLDGLVKDMEGVPAGVDEVIEGMKRDVKEAEVLLKGLQNHWMFRKAVREAREDAR